MCDPQFSFSAIRIAERAQIRAIERRGFKAEKFSTLIQSEISVVSQIKYKILFLAIKIFGSAEHSEIASKLSKYQDFYKEEWRLIPAATEAMAARFPPPATKYQRVDDHYALMELKEILVAALTGCDKYSRWELVLKTLKRTLIVTAPIGRCNAESRSTADGNYVVVLDDEILRVSTQMGLIFSQLIEWRGDFIVLDTDNIVKKFSTDLSIRRSYQSIVRGFVKYGSSIFSSPLVPREERDATAMAMFSQFGVMFVLAHELGHVTLGHLDRTISADNQEIDDLELAYKDEIDADEFASELVACVSRFLGYPTNFTALAAAAILPVYASVYRQLALRKINTTASELQLQNAIRIMTSHPPPEERLERIFSNSDSTSLWSAKVVRELLNSIGATECERYHPRWERIIQLI